NDMKCQLIERVKNSRFSLQLDESTDLTNVGLAHLMVFIRYSHDGKLHEDMLCCSPMEGRCTGLDWDKCISICTDGAGAMMGKHKGLKAKVLSVAPHVKFTHCIIHREALASKTLEPELNNVLQTAIQIVNSIKSRPLNSRLFALLCQEMGSAHESLLFHSEVRWLSRGKVLTRLFELRS
ncbi:zinc finger BED domain-containing protein 5-like, partial [Eleginops maclovinus]|uniref:zinc finger BED domain-containing protein 5-like n=1 Tax=Eleginops maclovinus TaxID=56733 RepID=UPI003080D7DE